MTKRSYRQLCSLARALDLVGERWTLLIVRDLLTGPKRYKELLEGLPGVGTNLLATRLKQLVELGLVELPPADAEGVRSYRLSASGQRLEEAVVALARFGAAHPRPAQPDDTWRPLWSPLALAARFRPEAAAGLDEEYEFRVGGEVFHARVRDGELDAGPGPARLPVLVLEADNEAFQALASGEVAAADAPDHPSIRVEGPRDAWLRCADLFAGPSV